MGNKANGRAVANLDPMLYVETMGGEVNDRKNARNTGIDYNPAGVYKYFKILREFALQRVRWSCNVIDPYELRLIEWNLFHYGKCAMVKPRITRNGIRIKFPIPRIYPCSFTEINNRTGKPEKISIQNSVNKHYVIDHEYTYNEFVIFSDEFIFSVDPHPFIGVAWEFANKLYNVDLAFEMNSKKLRFPFVFNDASIAKKDNAITKVLDGSQTVAEIMRSTFGRNVPYASIPQHMVGDMGNFMWEPQHVEHFLDALIEDQKKLVQQYLEMLGLYTNKEKTGVYTVKRLQENGDESPEYITDVLKATRNLCAEKACKMFNIDLSVEII